MKPIARIILYSIIICTLVGILISGMGFIRNNVSVKTGAETSGYTATADQIDAIQIDWAAGKINITADNTDTITVEVKNGTSNIMQNGRTLAISPQNKRGIFGIGSSAVFQDLHISVPKDWNCKQLEINAASTDITVQNLSCETVDIDVASGSIEFIDCSTDTIDFDSASGKLKYTGTLKSADLDGASLEADIQVTNNPQEIEMDSMSGKLSLTLPEDCGFRLNQADFNRSAKIEFETTEDKNEILYGDGACKINVDGLSVKIEILKARTDIRKQN